MSSDHIGFRGVTFAYRGATEPVINDLTFDLRNHTTFLLGENGAGKTTLMRLLLRQLKPQSGTVSLGRLSLSHVGYCPQDFTLPGHLSPVDYMRYLAWLRGVRRTEVRDAVHNCLTAVGLDPAPDVKMKALSGGTRRKVGLAASLLGNPALVLLDEPTVGLDPASRVMIRQTIAGLSSQFKLLISTHIVEDLPAFGAEADMLVLSTLGAPFFGHVADLEDQHGGAPSRALDGASPREAALIRIMRGE